MPIFVEIAVNVPQVRGVFHYHLPPELENRAGPGHFVLVPFGKQTVQGVILNRVEQPSVAETRPVLELLDPKPVLTPHLISLASWLAENNLTSLAAVIDLMLPPGLSQHTETVYTLSEAGTDPDRWPPEMPRLKPIRRFWLSILI